MKKATNTTEQVRNNPIMGLVSSLNIPAEEMRGQRDLISHWE